jgi:hypothetical protein
MVLAGAKEWTEGQMTIFIVRWQKGAKGNEHNHRDVNISEESKTGAD